MKSIVRTLKHPSFLAAIALAAALPMAASAQGVDTSDAQAFIGEWSASFESPQGELVMDIVIADAGGKVMATVGSDMLGGMQLVNDISKSGDDLVMRYEIDAQGQMAPVALTLSPSGAATMDFADGMFVMEGTATK